MTREELRAACLALPDTIETFAFGLPLAWVAP